jgi:hypothetical protein
MRPIYRLLATATLACFAANCLAANGSKSTAVPDQRGTEQLPFVIKVLPSALTQTTADQLKAEQERLMERAEDKAERANELAVAQRSLWETVAIGLVTAAILALQAIALARQTDAVQDSVKEMQTATGVAKSAADSAKQAADAAVASNSLGRAALIADQRPWIAIRGDPVAKGIEREPNGWRLKLMLMAQNTGKTPAHNVQLFLQIIPALPGAAIGDEDTHAKLRREAVTNALNWHGELFFPGDTARGLERGVLLADGLLAPWYAAGVSAYPILISGCIYYFADGFTEPRMTSFLVGIEQAGGGHVVFTPHSPVGTIIHASSLRTIRSKTGWSAD